MGANQPHAYVSGDCLEVMALSDNVIRCACTPKFKDTNVLLDTLAYSSGGKGEHVVSPIAVDDHMMLYRPPASVCNEFELEKITVNAEGYTILPSKYSSILLITENSCKYKCNHDEWTEINDGSVHFLPAQSSVELIALKTNSTIVWRAHVNSEQL